MKLNDSMSLKELEAIPELTAFKADFVRGLSEDQHAFIENYPVSVMRQAGWPVESMLSGLERLIHTQTTIVPLYEPEETANDREKAQCSLMYLAPAPEAASDEKPSIIVCAGGAYVSIWNLLEAWPVATRFSEMGYPCFCLSYRVGGTGVMPKPLEDLARAVQVIQEKTEAYSLKCKDYIVCGFSAGGNLAALWGTKKHGYARYELPAPQALIMGYPVTNRSCFPDNPDTRGFWRTMFGEKYDAAYADSFNVDTFADENYPPSYLVCCRDDQAVPCRNSELLKKRLDELGILSVLEVGEHGGHGFGEGTGTDVEGWISRAASFITSLKRRNDDGYKTDII